MIIISGPGFYFPLDIYVFFKVLVTCIRMFFSMILHKNCKNNELVFELNPGLYPCVLFRSIVADKGRRSGIRIRYTVMDTRSGNEIRKQDPVTNLSSCPVT